jgi:putative spermidine/putrescine transport system ATP-binding protein
MSFLILENITKVFKNVTAVDTFNLEVKQGEFVSFLGPSGCGKTTTLRMVAGFDVPTTGTITINGRDVTYQPPNQRNVGMVFQSYALFPNLTVGGNIGFGMMIARKPADEIKQRVKEMLDLIHLPGYDDRYPYQLSGGQQQRVALARALAVQPQVLLLDEPLSALDAKIRVELRAEIRRIQQKLGITTIYVTHDQEEALSLSDRIVVMNSGKIEQLGTPFEIYNYPTTDFVASFVGHLNVFEVEVKDPVKGICTLDGQTFITDTEHVKLKIGKAKLALRPEELTIDPKEGYNALHGVVDDTLFLGAIVRLRVKVGNATLLADLFNERQFVPPQVGEQVNLYFPQHACWVAS